MLSQAQNTFHHNPRLRGPVSSVVKYFETVYERIGKKLILSSTKSSNILNKLNSKSFLASRLSTNETYSLYVLSHTIIKYKLTDLIEQTFNREGSLYLACYEKRTFFTSERPKYIAYDHKVSEYDQEIPQSYTADQPTAP